MKKIMVAAVAAIALAIALAGWLIRSNTLTAAQLCVALAKVVATTPPQPGTADYAYYRAHPKKLAEARKRFLDQLPCRLPVAKTRP